MGPEEEEEEEVTEWLCASPQNLTLNHPKPHR